MCAWEIRSRLALERFMGLGVLTSECGCRWRGRIRATRPEAPGGRRAWWYESENAPSDVAARARRFPREPYPLQTYGGADAHWREKPCCAGDDGGTASGVRRASWPARGFG